MNILNVVEQQRNLINSKTSYATAYFRYQKLQFQMLFGIKQTNSSTYGLMVSTPPYIVVFVNLIANTHNSILSLLPANIANKFVNLLKLTNELTTFKPHSPLQFSFLLQ